MTVFGRRLLVTRVVELGWPVAHAAKAQGVSRQCAHRWIARWRAEGEAGLVDRSSRPAHSPARTSPATEARILAARVEQLTKTTGDGILLTAQSVDALVARPAGLVDRGSHALKGKAAAVPIFALPND